MKKEITKSKKNLTEDQLNKRKRLPYLKPELHLLDLDGTEGKSAKAMTESTNPISPYSSVGIS